MANATFWDKAAKKYAASKIADMGGYEETLARTRSFLHAEDHLLEIGCGTGSTALKLAPSVRQMTATDISGGMLAIANEKLQNTGLTNLNFVRTEATNAIEELFLMSKCLRTHVAELNPSLVFDLKKFHKSAWNVFMDFEHITVYESLLDNLERGKQEGFFRAEININVLAKLRVEQVHMSFDPHVFPKDEFDFTEVHMQMFDHYVYGLLTSKGLKLYEKYKKEN